MPRKNEIHKEAATIPSVKDDWPNKIIVKEGKNNIIEKAKNINNACGVLRLHFETIRHPFFYRLTNFRGG